MTNAGVKIERRRLAAFELALATLAFAAPLATYLYTLAPTITFGDAGELAVAATKLGVGHPPGYPLAALAGQLFTLAPFGAVAWKTNLASAAAMAATCFVIFLLLRMLFLSHRPGARVEAAVGAAAARRGIRKPGGGPSSRLRRAGSGTPEGRGRSGSGGNAIRGGVATPFLKTRHLL